MKIDKIRKEIDKVDSEITKNIAKRLGLMNKVAQIKYENGFKVINKAREKIVVDKNYQRLKKQGIDDLKLVKKIYNEIIKKSRKIQREVQKEISKKKKNLK